MNTIVENLADQRATVENTPGHGQSGSTLVGKKLADGNFREPRQFSAGPGEDVARQRVAGIGRSEHGGK